MNPVLERLIRGDDRSRLTITVDELAEVLNQSRSATYSAIQRGDVPSRRVGRRIVVPIPLLQQWLGLAVTPRREDVDHGEEAPVINLHERGASA